jgi:hypothetical protein
MRLTISTDFPQVQKRLDALQADVGQKALTRAVNGTVAQAKTEMTRRITARFNIKRAKVIETLSIKRATYRAGRFTIEAALESRTKRGRAINVINFQARQVKKPGGGVSVLIRKGAGRKLIKGAFIANQGRTVFKRTGNERLPIEAVQTVGVPQMFNTKEVNAAVIKRMKEKFPEIFEREAKFYLSKWKA